jgi:acyl dehydratase
MMREIPSLASLKELVGQEVALSDWVTVSQQRINQFAEATDDRQWIHIDPERARKETPFGGSIAHGFLTLSLLPMLLESVIHIGGVGMSINYGLNKVRFPSPLRSGGRIRARIVLQSVEDLKGCAQAVWLTTMECEGADKPVCVAESVVRLYPK